jgi:hypothetical protein
LARRTVDRAEVRVAMKGSPYSLWLSAANRAAGFWMGHAANAVRRQQRAALTELGKPAKPKRRRRTKRRAV